MKLRQIRFRNINSFYGEHPPIRFTEGALSSTGLFIISGPTGAGKSTLLDVITLALFNRIPRISGQISNTTILAEGLIVNQQAMLEPNTAAYAEVEYEVTGQVYRSRWSIKKNRNGNWNNYEMEVAHLMEGHGEGKLFPIKNLAEFPKKNEELIGLTYEQFIRSIVLAQGAFDQFLKAKAAERSKMLEKITGTEIYRQLSQRAFAEAKQLDIQLDSTRQAASLINVLDEEQVLQLKDQQKQIDAQLKTLDKRIEQLTTEQQLVRKLDETEQALRILKTRQEQLDDRQAGFAADALRLEKHASVADLAVDLSALQALREQQVKLLEQYTRTNETIRVFEQEQVSFVEKIQTLIKQEELCSDTLEEAVQLFREQVLSLERSELSEQEHSQRPLAAAQQVVNQAKEDWLRALDLTDAEAALEKVWQQLRSTVSDLDLLATEYATISPDTLSHELNQLVERIAQYTQLVALLEEQQERLTEGMSLKAKAETLEQAVTASDTEVTRLKAELEALEITKQNLEKEQRQLETEANLDELRKGLSAGNPCPLCGSLSHPYAQHYIQQVGEVALKLRVATADWTAKQTEYDHALRTLIQTQSDLTSFTAYRDKLRNEYKDRKEELSGRLAAVALDPDIQPTELRSTIKLLNLQRQDLTRLQTLWQQRDLLERLRADLELIDTSTRRANEYRAARLALYNGLDIRRDCTEVLSQFNGIQQQLASQRALVQKIGQEQKEVEHDIDSRQHKLWPLLQERGFADDASAIAHLLDPATVRRLQETQTSLQREAADIAQRTEEEVTRYNEALASRNELGSATDIDDQLRELIDQQRQILQDRGYVKKHLEQDGAERKRQQKIQKQLADLERKAQPWRELAKLIGSAKGDEYSKFAQGLTLAQLIGLSNRRLRDLTDRYLLLKPRDGQDELYVVDLYQGNAERSVSSLSGGETFTLSLSLALGLSDLASQNVQINSLFIDEGFGTLDPETLDTAIVMLEKLQHDSQKTIGIISHRHEIKERITVQIQVEKGADGNSKLKVVQ